MDQSRLPLALICLAAALASNVGCGRQTSAADPRVEEKSVVRYLPAAPDEPLPQAPLKKVGEVSLQIPDSLPGPAVGKVAFGHDRLFVGDFANETIWIFDFNGGFLRRLSQSGSAGPTFNKLEDVCYSARHERLFAANHQDVLAFRKDGTLDQRLTAVSLAHSLAETPNGILLVNSSTWEGPYWTAVDPGQPKVPQASFYQQRRELLPPGEEFLAVHLPQSRADVDSAGNVYVAATGLFEILKFDLNLQYLGDFRVQQDPNLILPPKELSEEQKMALKVGQFPKYSVVVQVAVASDRYLVLQYVAAGWRSTRLHFYHLDGRPAFAQADWKPPLLGRDSEGRLYFKKRLEPVLEIYELGATED